MARYENSYVYCSRHGEYEPLEGFVADRWYGDSEEGAEPRPSWVTDEIVADGFDEEDPEGAQFIKLKSFDEAGLLDAIESLAGQLLDDEPSGDDTLYDYYPSGCLLLQAMIADLETPAGIARGKELWTQLLDYIHSLEDGEVIMSSWDPEAYASPGHVRLVKSEDK